MPDTPPTPATPPNPAAPPKPGPEPDPKTGSKLDDLGVVGTILAAVGGGLGVLGFVAFFGSAILWVRMTEAGLPGNEAVAVMPKSVLVATGASFLVPALMVALGFTVLLYIADTVAKMLSEGSVRQLEKELRDAQASQQRAQLRAQALDSVVETAEKSREAASAAVAMDAVPGNVEEEAEDHLRNTYKEAATAREKNVLAKETVVEQKQRLKEMEYRGRERIERLRRSILVLSTIGLFGLGSAWVIWEYSVTLQWGRAAVLALLAGLLTTVCVVIRLRTASFGWFAVATFVSVGLMVGVLTYYRTTDRPKIEPAALLRANGSPVFGFFVSETSDRVYLGTTHPGTVPRLDAIPREEVLSLVVGRLQSPDVAERRALAFARELCLRTRERDAGGGKAKAAQEAKAGCTTVDLRRLNQLAAG